MMEISAVKVRELRERTGVGMMDCKRALIEAGGDDGRAVELLREKGLAVAAKKAGRIAAEGRVSAEISADRRIGVLLEMNCETDFAAKNREFAALLHEAAHLIIRQNPTDLRTLLESTLPNGETLADAVNSLINKTGENMMIRRFVRFVVDGTGMIDFYIHNDYLTEGKVGVMLSVQALREETLGDARFTELTKGLALQVASAKPEYIRREDVPSSIIQQEQAVYLAQTLNEGKSGPIAERVVQGRMERFYKEKCLMEQEFVKDPDRTVSTLLQSFNAELGGEAVRVMRFARFEKGEGIEKIENEIVG